MRSPTPARKVAIDPETPAIIPNAPISPQRPLEFSQPRSDGQRSPSPYVAKGKGKKGKGKKGKGKGKNAKNKNGSKDGKRSQSPVRRPWEVRPTR